MKDNFYLAWRYLSFYKGRTLILIFTLGLMLYLPNGLKRLIAESEARLTARAHATPLIIGSLGSSTDLVINSLYFEQVDLDPLESRTAKALNDLNFGYSIPMLCVFEARGFPIVGTNLDYFEFRSMTIAEGRNLSYIGECLIGAAVAQSLNIVPGDSLVSSPENFFDLAGVYPLKMKVVGILGPTDSPDDRAVFTDLKTTWVIMGLGHGHDDLQKIYDPTLIYERDSSNVTATAKLFIDQEIKTLDLNRFHFHGSIEDYPITSLIFVPKDHKSETILRGRFSSKELSNQIVVPRLVVEKLLESIFKIKELFNTLFILVGFSVLLILGLTVALSVKIRSDIILTMNTIGASKNRTIGIISGELLVILGFAIIFAFFLYSLTGLFVQDFMRYFVL